MGIMIKLAGIALLALCSASTGDALGQTSSRPFRIHGVVRDSLGQPVAGIWVSVLFNARLPKLDGMGDSVRTDQFGRFALTFATPERYDLAARQGDWIAYQVVVVPPDTGRTVTLRLVNWVNYMAAGEP